MAKIEVKQGGCGVKYKDEHGNERHALKTAESGPFECDDEQAARLVSLGVAVYVEVPAAEKSEATQENEEATGHLDEEQLKTMTNAQLANLAGELGIDVRACKKKADFIAAIQAYAVSIPDGDDGDELPVLSVADPE